MPNRRFRKDFKYLLIRQKLGKVYGRESAGAILAEAEKHYDDCVLLCGEASKGEWEHLSNTILPTVAVYKVLQNLDPERAQSVVRQILMSICETGGSVLGGVLRIPGMQSAFMKFLPKMATEMFGPRCGFRYENYEAGDRLLRMDMTGCPFCRYAALFGCPELMPVFCDSDIAVYGNLPGIHFERTQTLGSGGSCCDFRFIR